MSPEPVLEVLDGGLLTTIQDAGRPDWAHLGVPESGPADPWSLAVANVLLRNAPDAAAIEATVVGPTLRALRPITLSLAGADLGARVGARGLRPNQTHHLAAGDVLELPGGGRGSRAYIAIPDGVAVPAILGSRSTCLAGAFGGLDGRALRAGDVLDGEPRRGPQPVACAWPEPVRLGRGSGDTPILRVLPGPSDGLDALVAHDWQVAGASDRVGTRLEGPPLPDGIGGEATTFGVPWGAIQVPPDGRPIVLGPDHQTTGGYRVVGVVISADRTVLGQLGPGASVRFAPVTPEVARNALRDRQRALADGAAAVREAASWDAYADAAGG